MSLEIYAGKHIGQNGEVYHFENCTDMAGNPSGGAFRGPGITINWLDRPLPEAIQPMAMPEDVIAGLIYRISFFQGELGGDGKFACDENHDTLFHLREALRAQLRRTERRKAQGVEGQSHESPEYHAWRHAVRPRRGRCCPLMLDWLCIIALGGAAFATGWVLAANCVFHAC